MGMFLAVLVLAAISIGFVALMFLPLFFIWLLISVYREPWKEPAPEQVPEHLVKEPEAEQPQPAEVERPRVMAAGRRRPL